MAHEQTVSLQQMKDALAKEAGSKFPLKITPKDGEVMVRYIRGFADQKSNILLISENAYSLALKIIEVKDILKLEYAGPNSDGVWKVLHSKWLKKTMKPMIFFF